MLIFSVIAGVFCEPRLGRFHYLDSLSCQFMLYLQVKELKMIASVLSLEGDCFFCQDVQAVGLPSVFFSHCGYFPKEEILFLKDQSVTGWGISI